MAIPLFPIPFPQQGVFTSADLMPVRRQAAGVLQSGADVVIDRGGPQWTATWKTRTLTAFEMGVWKSWASSLRGAERFFLGYDPNRESPLAYMPQGYGAPIAAATVSALSAPHDEVSLQGLPAGLQMVQGDYISLAYGAGLVSLHVLLSAATADANGNLGAVWVEPEVPAAVAVGAAAPLLQPCAKFRLIKFDAPITAEGGLRLGAATISAISVSI